MFSFFMPVLVVSSIATFLTVLLVVAERYLVNYGECSIDINDGDKELKVQGGDSLLSSLTGEKIFIPSACGGRGTCGYCKVTVLEGGGPLLPTETPFLTRKEIAEDMRLSCQVKIRQDMRIAIPQELLAVKEYACRCSEIVDLTHDIKLFRFELVEPDAIDFVAGQYVQLFTPVYFRGGEEVYRAYSIASDVSEKGMLELIIRLVPCGICTTYCFEHLKAGDEVLLNGPYGEFCLSETDAPMIFVAGASGMAPIRSILCDMRNTQNRRKATYYFGANKVNELFMLDEMRQFEEKLADFKFVPVAASPGKDEQWDGEVGLVTEVVERGLKNASECEAYLCGSPGMIEACRKLLVKMGMGEDKIYFDSFE
ncbi:MAG: 2Fe-2S iron-sulfur cluster binding domain-containing protein [Planctomycetes bacterium]|nr:2Fe-2S iron-sulfur cluster binding domain-containing protein [Planctomycetota bacterium]